MKTFLVKSGKGFYCYDDRGKSTGVNTDVQEMFPESKTMELNEIQMRLILPMVNEACYILDEKIVNTAHVDLGPIFGIGFLHSGRSMSIC